MKKVTFILDKSVGKTAKANEIIAQRKHVWLFAYDLKSPLFFQSIMPETEVVVIDEVSVKHLTAIKDIITSKALRVERLFQKPIRIKRPEIIIISSSLTRIDFREEQLLDKYNIEIVEV